VSALSLAACGRRFLVRSPDAGTIDLLRRVFQGMLVPADASPEALAYDVERSPGGYAIRGDRVSSFADDDADLVFQVDKAITLDLQFERPDLFFVHAAALASGSRAVVLAAPPGTGKSTLTLALTDLGLTYLSDELAPIDLDTLAVHPYPHGLCLKNAPPQPLRMPADAVACGSRFHVPMSAPGDGPWTAAALVFLRRDAERFDRREVSAGSAAAMLMANALNPLAHEGDGLEAAVRLAISVPAFEIDITELTRAATLVRGLLD
jgi:hypothetical protein